MLNCLSKYFCQCLRPSQTKQTIWKGRCTNLQNVLEQGGGCPIPLPKLFIRKKGKNWLMSHLCKTGAIVHIGLKEKLGLFKSFQRQYSQSSFLIVSRVT